MMSKILKYSFVLAVVFPLVFLLGLSLAQQWQFPEVLPQQWTLQHWGNSLFQQGDILKSLFLSLGLSLSLAGTVSVFAFFMSKHIAYSKHRQLYMRFTLVPYILSPVVLAVIFQYYFTVANLSGNFIGVLIAQLFFALPFGIVIFNNFWNEHLKSIEQLSFTLGASSRQSLLKVILPLSKPAIVLCFFQSFLVSWFEYGLTQFIGLGKVKTLTVMVFSFINEANVFYAALACILLILPPIVLLYMNKKILILAR
ncbi:ABC transporter permease [Flavobacteriaceae bacterium 14752]|uniref:ABC transporter permease n=1 Tax=Mesohalobacter salilacus TaxID=2491711 RepID=UPI000F642CEC|nr:ABC transporter permease subunit [Flavobacteriaceae bacterium 14752]